MTFLIIAITVIFSYLAFNNEGLKHKYMLNPYQVVHNKEYYRIFSHAFLHADWMHLSFNMITLLFFGMSYHHGNFYGIEPDFKIVFGKLGVFYFFLLFLR